VSFHDILKGPVSTYALNWGIHIVFALAIFFIGRIVANVAVKILRRLLEKAKFDTILVNFICSLSYIVFLVFIVIAALHELGIDTTSLIAVLGAAGLAVGLALKNSLQNFASGIMLIIFRPFKIGDYVEVKDGSGTVERINVFNTVLKTPDNRQVIVPNGIIYDAKITNFSAEDTRRVDMEFSIGYKDDIQKAKEIIWSFLKKDNRILKDPEPLVAVGDLADNSVKLLVWPWVRGFDYWPVKFDLLEKIKLAFDREGITIPYPQMEIHLRGREKYEK